MRVLYIVHQFLPEFESGTERVTLKLARMMQRAGHHVHILACRVVPGQDNGTAVRHIAGARSGVVDGLPVTMLARDTLPPTAETSFDTSDAMVRGIETWLREQHFDVAHVMHTMRMATAISAVQRVGLPIVLSLTDFFMVCPRVNLIDADGELCPGPDEGRRCADKCPAPGWNSASLRQRHVQAQTLIGAAAVCTVPSTYVASALRAAMPGTDPLVLPHGVDVLAAVAKPLVVRSEGILDVGFVGSILPAKGLQVLMEALAMAPELRMNLWVAGAHRGDPAYTRHINQLALADPRVTLLGHRGEGEIRALMAQLDLLCIPSLVPESFSLVLHEAAAFSVPAMVSDLGATAQLIGECGGGCVVETGDVAAWTRALRKAVQQPELRMKWRSCVRPPHRIEEEAFLFEALYRRAIV